MIQFQVDEIYHFNDNDAVLAIVQCVEINKRVHLKILKSIWGAEPLVGFVIKIPLELAQKECRSLTDLEKVKYL